MLLSVSKDTNNQLGSQAFCSDVLICGGGEGAGRDTASSFPAQTRPHALFINKKLVSVLPVGMISGLASARYAS